MTKFDLRTLHPNFFTEDRANGRIIHQWSIKHFTPVTYHRPEHYVKCLVNMVIRRDQLEATPEFTATDASRLSAIRANRNPAETEERHRLEAKRDAVTYASAMLFGANIELNRARRSLTQIDITYINDLLIMSAKEATAAKHIITETGHKIAIL